MKNYIFNACGVCTNPDTPVSISVKGGYCDVRVAYLNGWKFAYSIGYGTGGQTFGVWDIAKPYPTAEEAVNVAKSELTKAIKDDIAWHLKSDHQKTTIQALNDLLKELSKTVQQSLF